jgi:hypothetical protein
MTMSLEELSEVRPVWDITSNMLTEFKVKLPGQIRKVSGYKAVVASIGYWGDDFNGSPGMQKSAISIHGVRDVNDSRELLYSTDGPDFKDNNHIVVVACALDYLESQSCLDDLKNVLTVRGEYFSH